MTAERVEECRALAERINPGPEWTLLASAPDASAWKRVRHGETLKVLASVGLYGDGRLWMHVSLSVPDRMPTWGEVVKVKEAFIGAHKRAIQVIPPRAEWINDHPYCLHLWHCIDDDGLPDFRRTLPNGQQTI